VHTLSLEPPKLTRLSFGVGIPQDSSAKQAVFFDTNANAPLSNAKSYLPIVSDWYSTSISTFGSCNCFSDNSIISFSFFAASL
jgi:hypothetical protein